MKTSKNAKLSPRINVSVQYDVPFEEVVQKITLLFETLVKVFSEIKSREKRTFEEKELYAILKERLPEFDISSIQLGLILDMITLPSLGGGFLRLGTEDDLIVQSNAKLLQMDGSLERRLKSTEAALEPYQQYL